MEDLNKNQIVLLTILISFVTSIATGIMTVSLLQQAPVEVVRNMNRIVQQTIEKVTPTDPNSTKQKEVTTIVVKEEDSIVDAINKNVKSLVRIAEKDMPLGGTSFYSIGLVMNKDGVIVADRKKITSGNVYTATMNDGTEFTLAPQSVDKNTNFILFRVLEPGKYVFVPATLSDAEPKLGQTLVSLGGNVSNAVSVGRVTSLQMKDVTVGTTTTKYLASIDTDVASKDLVDGTPLIDLSGNVVGIRLLLDTAKVFTPVSILKKELITLTETPKTPVNP
jgi:S1-C subfamily serine protease